MYLIRVTGDGQLLQESIYLSLSVEITLNYKQFNFNLDFYTKTSLTCANLLTLHICTICGRKYFRAYERN